MQYLTINCDSKPKAEKAYKNWGTHYFQHATIRKNMYEIIKNNNNHNKLMTSLKFTSSTKYVPNTDRTPSTGIDSA